MNTDTTDTIIKASVTTNCECEEEVEGTNEMCPASYCFGCDEDNREELDSLLHIWLERQTTNSNRVRVYSPAMGWLRQEAWTVTDVTSLLDSVRLDGDYTLNFTLDNKDLSAVRYSHDEPTGAPFVFNLVTEEDDI